MDKFSIRHRAGYARVYSPEADRHSSYENGRSVFGRREWTQRNNLPYVLNKNYNYDRERTPNEGNDWA
jgi:hypothetical protein